MDGCRVRQKKTPVFVVVHMIRTGGGASCQAQGQHEQRQRRILHHASGLFSGNGYVGFKGHFKSHTAGIGIAFIDARLNVGFTFAGNHPTRGFVQGGDDGSCTLDVHFRSRALSHGSALGVGILLYGGSRFNDVLGIGNVYQRMGGRFLYR